MPRPAHSRAPGETFTLDTFEEAFAVMTRQMPGHDAVRVALRLT